MKLVKALTALGIARSGAEANRFVRQGAIWVGGCIPPCNARMFPFKCVCGGWRKATDPIENIPAGVVVRLKDGNWRLMPREGTSAFDQVPGIGWVPEDLTLQTRCDIIKP